MCAKERQYILLLEDLMVFWKSACLIETQLSESKGYITTHGTELGLRMQLKVSARLLIGIG